MKPATAIFAISLFTNVALTAVMLLWVRSAESSSAPRREPALTISGQQSGVSNETKRLLEQSDLGDLERLRDQLLAEGLSELVVYDILKARIAGFHQRMIDSADPNKRRPWWQQTVEELPGEDVVIGRLKARLWAKEKSLLKELFPRREKRMLNEMTAFLPPTKREAVQRIMDDQWTLWRRVHDEAGNFYTKADRERSDHIEADEKSALREILTAKEYDELVLRRTGSARHFKAAAASLDLTEHQFRGLMEIDEWATSAIRKLDDDDRFSPVPIPPERAVVLAQVNEEKQAFQRNLLGAEKYERYLLLDDFDYQKITRLVARFELPLTVIPEYFELSRRLKAEVEAVYKNTSDHDVVVRLEALGRGYETRIGKLLGPVAAEEDLRLIEEVKRMRAPTTLGRDP